MPRNKQLLKARGSHPVANRRSGTGSGGMPQKRIVIRPYRSMPTLPANYYEVTAQPLLESVLEALEPQKQHASTTGTSNHKMSLQNAYTAVVHLVSHQFGPRLYTDLQQTLRTAAARVLQMTQHNKTILQFVPEQYGVYTDFLLVCKHVFLPLQGHQAAAAAGVWQVGLQVFSERLQETGWDVTLYQEWLAALLEAWETGHAAATTSNLKAVWYLWQDLAKLASLPLARDLEEYWSNKSVQLVEYHGHGDDVYPTQAILQYCTDKHQAVSRWTWLPCGWLWQILDTKLVQPHLQADTGLLYAPHLVPLLEREVFQRHETTSVAVASSNPNSNTSNSSTWTPIQQLWMLAMRLPGGQAAVAAAICQFGRTQGLQRVIGTDKPSAVPTITSNSAALQVVADILELQQALAVLVQTLPGGSDWINLKSVWEEVVNADVSPPLAESLAKFLDQILRSTKKMDQYQSQSGDAWLNKIVAGLFVPLQAKDVFEAFYKRDLAKRLLWNRVVSIDVEKQVCSLLKAECGAGYTSKMEGMFQDVEYSKETMNVYKQSYQQQQNNSLVEMEVQVLTTGYWPVYPQYPSLILPDSLLAPQELFGNHYKTKYQGRRMTWQYALGHCLVRANGFSKTYELVVSLCQALVLVQFQSTESKWTLKQLCKAVGLEDRDEMERLLQSLSLGKEGTRILRKHDWDAANRRKVRMTVDDDRDVFTINHAYTSNQRRIRINNIMMKETKEEREKTVEAVSRDRLYLIDAVLVRILKARKTILHQALIPQVLEQVKVPAQPGDIKKRIESLIEREYMERDEKDRNRYNYLA